MTEPTSQPKPSRRIFFWVLVAFFAPLALAFVIYYGTNWHPAKTVNKGDLITPAVSLPDIALHRPDGSLFNVHWLQKKWTLVYVGDGACDQTCRDALLITRNIRLLLGKDSVRVQRAFLFVGACCDQAYFSTEQTDVLMGRLDDVAGQMLLNLFPHGDSDPLQAGKIYIIDPLGNLMMSYKRGTEAGDVLADLKKLLSLSHIG